MKIASIVCVLPPAVGGIGNSAQRINKLLAAKHDVTVFAPSTLKPWFRLGHGAFMPQLLFKLKDFDYIYLHYPFFGTAEVVWLLKLFRRRPKLIIQYHMDVRGLSPIARILSWPSFLIRRSLFNQAETIICSSLDYIKTGQIKDYYAAHPDKFQEIPFGVDISKFQPKLINRPMENKSVARAQAIVRYINDNFIKRHRLNLLFVGGLDRAHYFKGVEVLINALSLLEDRDWRLKIVGDGDLRAHYEDIAQRSGLSRQIEFAGRLEEDDLVRAFQDADLFLLPSINGNEAFGLVLIEALACGVPVIASNLPGVRQVFTDNTQGLLVEPGNAEDLKEKIQYILDNGKARHAMSVAARRLAEERYDEKQIKARLENLFTAGGNRESIKTKK